MNEEIKYLLNILKTVPKENKPVDTDKRIDNLLEKLEQQIDVKSAEEYFKKWSENCRIFIDYKPIHSHKDMIEFAESYHQHRVNSITDEMIENQGLNSHVPHAYQSGAKWFKQLLLNK